MWKLITAVLLGFGAPAIAGADDMESAIKVSDGFVEDGIHVHQVVSPYQSGTTLIRVLLPAALKTGKRYPVIYILPVERGTEQRYGDGLLEIKRLGLHETSDAIFVAPTFSHLPWYADHPDKPDIRQESYFLKVVLPYIDKTYPVEPTAQGRMLLGFSKSGWGAWTLLLRHPDVFGRSAAWDAPLMMDQPGKYGSGEIFGTAENFEPYRITSLLKKRAEKLHEGKRLFLLGYGNFRHEHEQVHRLMTELKIAHEYRDGPARKHDWHSGWVSEAVSLLIEPTKDEEK